MRITRTLVLLSCVLYIQAYSSLCVRNNTSCASQLWDESADKELCSMTYYDLDGDTCYNKQFTSSDKHLYFGSAKLQAYVDESRTVFNVTFSDVKWKDLQMRFKHPNIPKKSMCRDFSVNENVTVSPDKYLRYDCPWNDISSEGYETIFEYSYGDLNQYSTKKYIFTVPQHEKLETKIASKLELFLYVDVTDLNNLILKIQSPPILFNITDFEVRVYRKRNKDKYNELDIRILSNSMKEEELEFPYLTWGEYGQYYFSVKPINNNQIEFVTSVTPNIMIHEIDRGLTIGIVGVSALIPVILFIFYLWKKYSVIKNPHEKQPNVLFVYFPAHNTHIRVISVFAKMLQEFYKMNIMLDYSDIPFTLSKDPFKWMSSSFHSADYVVFFTSPESIATAKIHPYKDLYNLALRLTKTEFSKKISSKKLMIVTFPYSNQSIPTELVNFKSYKITKDLNKFLNVLLNRKFWQQFPKKSSFVKTLNNVIEIAEKEMNETIIDDSNIVQNKCNFSLVQEDSTLLTSPADVTTRVPSKKIDLEMVDFPYTYKVADLNLLGVKNNESRRDSFADDSAFIEGEHIVNVQDLDL